MHASDRSKSGFVSHVEGASIVLPSGKQHAGNIFEQMVEDDRQAGSWLQPFNPAVS